MEYYAITLTHLESPCTCFVEHLGLRTDNDTVDVEAFDVMAEHKVSKFATISQPVRS
jgi:hypothetical protein